MKSNNCTSWILLVLLVFGLTCSVSIAQGEDLSDYLLLNEDAVGNVLVYNQKENGQEEQVREIAAGIVGLNGLEAMISGELSTGCWSFEGEAMGWSDDSLVFFAEADCLDGEMEVMFFESGLDFLPRFIEENETVTRNPLPELQTQVVFEKKEDVSVPAGTFEDCIKLKVTFQEEGEIEECQSWYAESVGMVKSMCTETFEGQTANSSEELFAALIDGELIGNPMQDGEVLSFALATAGTSQCGMLLRNIVLQGEKGPELWWATFYLDELEFKWKITNAGKQKGEIPEQACNIPGLDFTGVLTTIRNDDMSGQPMLNMVLPFYGSSYALGFVWNVNTLSWDYLYLFEL